MSKSTNPLNALLRHHVTGAIERGEAEAIVEVPPEQRTKMKIHSLIGHKVTAHHPRGGHIIGVVLKVEREEGRGMVATLDTGYSIATGDVISKEPVPKIYATTYCNHGHSMATGKPIGHECYHIPPAALRLERHGFTNEAIAIMQAAKAGAPR